MIQFGVSPSFSRPPHTIYSPLFPRPRMCGGGRVFNRDRPSGGTGGRSHFAWRFPCPSFPPRVCHRPIWPNWATTSCRPFTGSTARSRPSTVRWRPTRSRSAGCIAGPPAPVPAGPGGGAPPRDKGKARHHLPQRCAGGCSSGASPPPGPDGPKGGRMPRLMMWNGQLRIIPSPVAYKDAGTIRRAMTQKYGPLGRRGKRRARPPR